MKKIILAVALFSLLLTSACNLIGRLFEDKGNEADGYIKSSLARETSPEIDPAKLETVAQDSMDFALLFYKQSNQGSGNIVFSPFSISLALSMALAGAETSTETGMLEALQFSLPEEDIHPSLNALLLAIEESQQGAQRKNKDDQFQLNIANSLWGQAGFEFKDAFLDTLALNYGVGMYAVDFEQYPEESRQTINDWVADETEDKIQDLIPSGAIDPLTRLVLTNAIYFNGSWLYPFAEEDTYDAPFTLLDDSETTVDMMRLDGEEFNYLQGESYQAVQLPYFSTDFVMTLIVPDSGAFTEVEEGLSADILLAILNEAIMQRVDIQMPKFDYETTINANGPLVALGMAESFNSENADFSGITEEEKLYITDVLHKATITVDEGGTVAAAATSIIFGLTSALPEEPIELVIDRPFLFFIQHEPTGTILFMGRVTQP